MKILVDCSTAKLGGAKTYFQQILRATGELGGSHSWVFYGPYGCRRALAAGSPSVELREIPRLYAGPLGSLGWFSAVLPRIIRRERADVLFATTGFGMLSPPCPQMILIRNPIYFSDLYEKQIKNPWLKVELFLRRSISLRMIRSSAAVLFPTRAMGDLVTRYLALDPDRVVIAPYGCDGELFRRPSQDAGWLPEVLVRTRKQFLLNVSLYCAQKNFTVLFKALGILRQEGEIRPLALTTYVKPASNSTYPEDRAVIVREHLEEQVLQLGPVPRKRLPALYQAAGLFVFPSFVESFGHPLVEAMAAGLPILAADTPVNREVCGPAAVYVPPFDPQAWAVWIRRLLGDPAECERLRQSAQIQAAGFSWRAHVSAVVQTAERLAGAP